MNTHHEYQIRNGQLRFEDGTTLTVISSLAEQAHYYHQPQRRPRSKGSPQRGNPDPRRRYIFAGV